MKQPTDRYEWKENSDPDGIRTRDPNIKSVVLYQLSYEIKIDFLQIVST